MKSGKFITSYSSFDSLSLEFFFISGLAITIGLYSCEISSDYCLVGFLIFMFMSEPGLEITDFELSPSLMIF